MPSCHSSFFFWLSLSLSLLCMYFLSFWCTKDRINEIAHDMQSIKCVSVYLWIECNSPNNRSCTDLCISLHIWLCHLPVSWLFFCQAFQKVWKHTIFHFSVILFNRVKIASMKCSFRNYFSRNIQSIFRNSFLKIHTIQIDVTAKGKRNFVPEWAYISTFSWVFLPNLEIFRDMRGTLLVRRSWGIYWIHSFSAEFYNFWNVWFLAA